MKQILPILAIAALGLAGLPANAATTHHSRHYRHHAAYRHIPARAGEAYAYQPQIACSVVGCHPVPRGCHPEMGYSFDGEPTGLDVAVCGNTTLYGNRR
jgi:hypothetical protein